MTKSENGATIQQAFTAQAAGFESGRMSFSKQDYLQYVVQKIAPAKSDAVLEVAAGTCACGRALAARAGHVACLDITPAMLAVGKAEAEKACLENMTFVLGDAAALPFLNASFSLVLSRLAFHHFPQWEPPFAEMVRVLRPGGRLVLIDMEAALEPLRETRDELERLRDPSHVRNLSRAEMLALYAHHGLEVTCCETTPISVDLQSWLALTHTPTEVCRRITACMESELQGGAPTGFAPYCTGGTIRFDQQWTLVIGRKA